LLAVEGAGVLQTFNVQIAADVGDDAVAADAGAFDLGVAATDEGGHVAGVYAGVVVAHVAAIGVAARDAHAGFQSETVLAATQGKADAQAGAAGLVIAGLAVGTLGGQ